MRILEKLAARNAETPDRAAALIACLGDSVTHGCFEVFKNRFGKVDTVYRPEGGYPARLRRRLNLLYPASAVNVLNAGVSGDSSAGGLRRLERGVLSHLPDLVTVNFGLNDAMGGRNALSNYRSNMRALFSRILDSGAECMLVTPNRMCSYVSHALSDSDLRAIAAAAAEIQTGGTLDAFVEAAREEAQRLNVPIADAYRVWNRLERSGADTTALLANAINHPIPEMHELFAEKIVGQMLG